VSWNWGQNFLFSGLGAFIAWLITHLYHRSGSRKSEERYNALQNYYNHLIEHFNALIDKVTALSQQTQELLQKVEEINKDFIVMRSKDQPIPQDQVKSFSDKVEAVTATATALRISAADTVKFSEEVTGEIVRPYALFPNGKKTE
jgi:uncharacterized protein YoxC